MLTEIKEFKKSLNKKVIFMKNLLLLLTKWSNTLKQFVGNLSTNVLSVFDHFVKENTNDHNHSAWKKFWLKKEAGKEWSSIKGIK